MISLSHTHTLSSPFPPPLQADHNRDELPGHILDDTMPVYELYRVRLPLNRFSSRGVILGEGKPENQNHATIFAHNEALQAIDMNQVRVSLRLLSCMD
jgi:hypothetical protein